jgi:hypothetical protein
LRQRGSRWSVFLVAGDRLSGAAPDYGVQRSAIVINGGPLVAAWLCQLGRVTYLRQFLGSGWDGSQQKCKSKTKRFQFTTSLHASGDVHLAITPVVADQRTTTCFARNAHAPQNCAFSRYLSSSGASASQEALLQSQTNHVFAVS